MESLYGKNPAKYVHLWGSSPQGNIFLVKKRRSILHYYKNPKPSENKVHIIYLSAGTLELWKFSNLTFGGSLASTTLVLSVRFSSSLLCRFCLEHVKTVQLTDNFQHHQCGTRLALAGGIFFSLDKIALLTHFPPFHFLFPTKSYFTNILLSTFFHFTNIKLNFFPFTNIKEKIKRWRNINKGLRNN